MYENNSIEVVLSYPHVLKLAIKHAINKDYMALYAHVAETFRFLKVLHK